jgi:transcriptional regulator with XRE-family HTH domain
VKPDEESWHQVGEFIRDQRRQAEMSVRRLADAAGISNPYLSQIERGLKRPSAEILGQIARALSISSETMYRRAGLLDEDVGSGSRAPSVVDAVWADPDLDDEQKRTLIRVYETLRVAGEPR